MFDWFDKTFRRRNYPTWNDIPPASDMEKIGADMKKTLDHFNPAELGNEIVPFPRPKSAPPPMPEVKEPAKPAVTYYRLGLTDNNRVSFQMGYSEITMNKQGVDNLIQQLAVFRDQLQEDTEEDIND